MIYHKFTKFQNLKQLEQFPLYRVSRLIGPWNRTVESLTKIFIADVIKVPTIKDLELHFGWLLFKIIVAKLSF